MKKICPICGKEKRPESKTCRACYLTNVESGEKSKLWKGGKPKCKKCGKTLSDYVSELCRDCYQAQSRGENNPNWRGGKPKCKICGKELSDYVSTYCRKCSNQMEQNPNWQGGRAKHGDGYVWIKKPDHPNANRRGYVFEHRLVMSEHLGRPLDDSELVHHVDEDKTNNNINNLQLVTRQEHRHEHRGSRKFSIEQIEEMIRLYLKGLSSVQISSKFETTPQSVLYWLKSKK